MRLRAVAVAALGAQLWAVAAPAEAHTIHPIARSATWTAIAAHGAGSGAVLLPTLLLGGLLIAPLLVGWPWPARRWTAAVGGIAAVSAFVDLAVLAARPPWVVGGWPTGFVVAHLACVVLAVSVGYGRGLAAAVVGVGLLLTAALAGQGLVSAVHLVAAAVWLGGVTQVLLTWGRGPDAATRFAAAARRFGPVAVASAAVTVATGVWNMRIHLGALDGIRSSTYGRVLVAKLLLVGVVVVLGALVQRRRSVRWLTAEAGTLAAVVLAAAVLLAVPVPFKGTALRLGEVVDASSAGDPECASRHLGHVLAVQEVNALHPGAVRLVSAASPRSLAYAGRAKALLTACAPGSTELGTVPVSWFGAPAEAAAPTAWPVEPSARQVGDGFATFFAAHRITHVAVVIDGSSRSAALADGLRSRADVSVVVRRAGGDATATSADDAVVLATGWGEAGRVLQSQAASARGTFLAPWLLTPSLLGHGLRTTSAQVTIGSSLDPQGAGARHYLAALARFAPGRAPSGPGLQAYLEARVAMVAVASGLSPAVTADRPMLREVTAYESSAVSNAPAGLQFFTPTRATILPPSLGHDHSLSSAWVPGGQLAAISGLVPL